MEGKQKVLISLIGHQPLPILMTIRHVRPDKVIFLLTNDAKLSARKGYLLKLIEGETQVLKHDRLVDPWNLLSVPQNLDDIIFDHELEDAELLFDATGGTKAMSIGLTYAAMNYSKMKRDVKVLYLESDSAMPKLHYYSIDPSGSITLSSEQIVNVPINIQDFWIAYLGIKPKTGVRDPNKTGTLFEEDLEKEFAQLQQEGLIDEFMTTILPPATGEIDFVLRNKNRFVLVECKAGGEARKIDGIYLLSNWASDKYLGIYTGKLLAVAILPTDKSQFYPTENSEVAKAQGVTVLEVLGWNITTRSLTSQREKIRTKIREVFKL